MHYQALAVDYDGTIAHDGVVSERTLDGLRRVVASGRRIILVTGRELEELKVVFPGLPVFDRVVAENGALLYTPATKGTQVLTPPPPPAFVAELVARGIPVAVGKTIVATVEPHEHAVLSVIHDLGLEWHVIFNKGSVMALPSTVTKATGLTPALKELCVEPQATVGIGDAENDHAFLRMCGFSVAVANALPTLKASTDWTTVGARGDGVVEVIDRLLADDLTGVLPRQEKHVQPAPPVPKL